MWIGVHELRTRNLQHADRVDVHRQVDLVRRWVEREVAEHRPQRSGRGASGLEMEPELLADFEDRRGARTPEPDPRSGPWRGGFPPARQDISRPGPRRGRERPGGRYGRTARPMEPRGSATRGGRILRSRGGRRCGSPDARDRSSARAPAPGRSPRPVRPATWATSWNVRSAARKSGRCSATSASTTPTSVTLGKSSPLAIICVPSRILHLARLERRQRLLMAAVSSHRVGVHPSRLVERELHPDLALEPLGADPPVMEHRRLACGAGRRACALGVACMADRACAWTLW